MSTIKDRSRLCAFSFADGRQCRTPRRTGHPHLCYFHAEKEVQSRAAREAGEAISSFFFGDFLSASDLSTALGRVFSAVAQGHIKPKAATALAYLSQTMIQSIPIAQHEYCEAFSSDAWRRAIRSSFTPSVPVSKPALQPAPPAPLPPSQVTPQPTSQPAPPAVPNPINIDQTS